MSKQPEVRLLKVVLIRSTTATGLRCNVYTFLHEDGRVLVEKKILSEEPLKGFHLVRVFGKKKLWVQRMAFRMDTLWMLAYESAKLYDDFLSHKEQFQP